MEFISPTKGKMSFEEVYEDIIAFMSLNPEAEYRVIIGSDSQGRTETCFVTAIIIHQVGRGARYYYRRQIYPKMQSLRQRILYEALLSLETASKVAAKLAENGHGDLNVEIHLDIGNNGKTKELIREVVGIITGSGFDAHIKPDSCGAKVADKHTK